MKNNQRIYAMPFCDVYPLYIAKVERKGRTKGEVDQVIQWLTGYDDQGLNKVIEDQTSFERFFDNAPQMNPNAHLIKGVICGYRIEEIEEETLRKIRYLDKLVDEIAKGRSMDKILRK